MIICASETCTMEYPFYYSTVTYSMFIFRYHPFNKLSTAPWFTEGILIYGNNLLSKSHAYAYTHLTLEDYKANNGNER